MIGEFNRRINLKSWGKTQDEAGGLSATLTNSYIIWAKVEDRSGNRMISEQQQQWSYDYKVTFRYENSRPVNSSMTIDYDSKRLAINSLSYKNEGKRAYCVARCSTVDILTVLGSPVGDISGPSYYCLNILFRIGDEGWPVDGDTVVTITDLIGLDEDKFTIFRNGLPMWPEEEYHFDPITGTITLLVPNDQFNQGEQFLLK